MEHVLHLNVKISLRQVIWSKLCRVNVSHRVSKRLWVNDKLKVANRLLPALEPKKLNWAQE